MNAKQGNEVDPAMHDSTLPLISVVICTYNRADTLRRAITSLLHLKTEGLFRYEIVVIDNFSTDHTPSVVEECANQTSIDIRHCVETKAGIPFARNRQVAEARGEWLAFFDDDQLAAPNWLSVLYKTAREKKVLCVGGARSLRIEADPVPPLSLYSRYLLGEISAGEPCYYHLKFLPCTGNVLVAKRVFDQVGTFNEKILDGGEDSDFFNRMIELGFKAFYQPEATVEHIISPNRLEAKYLIWIAYRHGMHLARRDRERKGKLGALFLAGLRWLQAGANTVPQLLWAKMLGHHQDAVALRSKLQLVCGYTQFSLKGIPGASLSNSQTAHRGKG